MPKYKCKKEVWALKIGDIVREENSYVIHPENSDYAPFAVSSDYVIKHSPTIGGYYVIYKDGYESYSPAGAFEEGYDLI